MEKLTTKRLVAYRNSLLKCNDWPYDEFGGGAAGLGPQKEPEKDRYGRYHDVYKNSQLWKDTYDSLKQVLSNRENV